VPKQLDSGSWNSSLNGATFKPMDGEGKLVKKSFLKQKGFLPLSANDALTYVRNQEREYADALEPSGVIVQRAGQDLILVIFDEIMFANEQWRVNERFYKSLDFIVKELNKYNRSYVEVLGFTDTEGTAFENQMKSNSKAMSVASYLVNNGVNVHRVFVDGRGENYPIADNASPRGRSLNKRVEIRIAPIFE
jgi:outer membrane protein OmpA-like peptidoglycan-associated protein